MPSTYAHYRMGQKVRSKLRGNEKRVIEQYPELYYIGLHGPDILFYYKPLKIDPVNQIGYGTHAKAGREFFESARRVLEKHHGEEAYLAYIYGFICHFALDVSCHGYIDEKIAKSGISHTEIEVEFDRDLLIKDGKDPIRENLTKHIVPSVENADVIKDFFAGVTTEQVKKSLRGMISYNNLLIAPSRFKRSLVYGLLRSTGNYTEMHGLLVNYERNPQCNDSTTKLGLLYKDAAKLAEELIFEYSDYLEYRKELREIYNYTFGTQLTESEDMAG